MNDLEPNFDYADNGYPVKEPVSYFAISLRQPNKIRLINVGPELVRCIQERLEQLIAVETFGYVIFKDYMQTSFTGRFNIYDIILEKQYFQKPEDGTAIVSREDSTLINVAFCRILGTLFCYGYDVVVSSDLARDSHSHTTVFFRLRDPHHDYLPLHYYSHKFICVTPYSTDSILLINIPKVAVEPILKIIHLTWSPGIKSKQTLADDERSVSVVISLKLSGSPWNQAVFNSGKATIQARLIILELTRILATHKWRFATNINFSGTTDSFFYQWCPNLELDEYRYCAIILSRYDRLRMLHVPTNLVPVIRECANKFWYLQVDKQKDYHGTTELKLGGCPWWADGNDAVEARYFISSLIGALKANGWEVTGTIDLSRHNNDKSTFLLRQCGAQFQPHMCISFNRANRIRLIVGSSDISEEAELQLTTRMNEIIKQRWVALGPRNYGKSVEWKLEGDPWDTEGLYSDHTRGVYLLCLILEAIQPLGWKLVSSADISAKNLDANERGYALVGKPEDMHTWFFLYDVTMRRVTFPLVEAEIGAAHQLMSMAHDYHYNKKDISGSSSVPNLESGDPMSPHRTGPPAYQHPPHSHGPVHHHYRCSSRQQVSSQQSDDLGMSPYPQTNLQSNRSRSVPSVAAAVTGNSMDPYSSHNSLYGPSAMDGQHSYGFENRGHYFPDNYYGEKTFSTFRAASTKPCYANGRCQSRQKTALVRQASAGSLPHDHRQQQGCGTPGRGASSYNLQHTSDDLGYKSDGEGYKSDGGGCYRGCASAGPQPFRNQQFQQQGHQQRQPEYYDSGTASRGGVMNQRSSSGSRNGYLSDGEGYILQQQQNRRVTRSGKYGGSHSSSPGAGSGPGGLPHQGEVEQNQTPDDEEDEEEDEEEEDDVEEITNEETQIEAVGHHRNGGNGNGNATGAGMILTTSRRASSASAKATVLAAAVTSISNAAGNMLDDPDVIVSYSAFQAEAAINRSGRSSGANSNAGRGNSGSCEELYTLEVTEAAVRRSNSGGCVIDTGKGSQRNSRSNSRQEFHSGSETGAGSGSGGGGGQYPCNSCRGAGMGRASSRQSDRQSDGGYRSDGLGGGRGSAGSGGGCSGSRTGIDGYRSEGSTDSPQRQNQNIPNLINNKGVGNGNRAIHHRQPGPQGTPHYHTHQGGNGAPPQVPPHLGPNAHLKQPQRNGQYELTGFPSQQQCSTSRSMHSFQRQESSASFQSGHSMRSTHSAPTCPNHGLANRHNHPPQHQNVHQQHHRHQGYHPTGNLESCSTQSSSSSASAPPDYATCSAIPPSYDQVLNAFGPDGCEMSGGPHHHHRRKPHRDQSNHQRGHSASRMSRPGSAATSNPNAKRSSTNPTTGSFPQTKAQDVRSNNDFYYVGEFYG